MLHIVFPHNMHSKQYFILRKGENRSFQVMKTKGESIESENTTQQYECADC